MTGVLPQPWLPLKKGETLVNRPHENGFRKKNSKVDENTLVLTLRRRSSTIKRRAPGAIDRQSPRPPRHSQSLPPNDLLDMSNVRTRSNTSNAGPSSSDEPPLRVNHHRLSYDPASGIMVLPDSDDWLDSDESGSDEEFVAPAPAPGSPARQTSVNIASGTPYSTAQELSPSPRISIDTPRRRHGIYFHHPERRISRLALNMPGEFRDNTSNV